MKSWLSKYWPSGSQEQWSERDRKQARWMLWVSKITADREVPSLTQAREAQVVFLSWEIEFGTCGGQGRWNLWIEHQRGRRTERVPRDLQMCEETTELGKEPWTYLWPTLRNLPYSYRHIHGTQYSCASCSLLECLWPRGWNPVCSPF